MGLLSGDRIIVGYDLGNEVSQISYSLSESGEVETLSQVAGAEHYNMPTVRCKRCGVNQWFYGKEAIRYSTEQQGILVDNLLALALDGEPVLIEGDSLDPVALLTLFVKRSLGMLSQIASPDRISAMMITCETLDHRILEVLGRVIQGLHLKTDKIAFESHTESYYNYMIHQPEELWMHRSVLFHYNAGGIKAYRLECNQHTTPVVAFIDEREFPFPAWETVPEEEAARQNRLRELDEQFLKIAGEICEGGMFGSVFLIGDGFDQEWLKESLKLLCKESRVFQGNNLFSKGACFGMQERLCASESGRQHVFLGNDKLKANIGMKVLRQGEESYYALLDAGINWYEAENQVEFYLQDGNALELVITPLIGQKGKVARITLEDFPGTIARLRVRLRLESENVLAVEIEDEGLGEIRPATGKIWKEQIEMY